MALLMVGYWPTTYWSDSYWADDYWPDYGSVGPLRKDNAFILLISIIFEEEGWL